MSLLADTVARIAPLDTTAAEAARAWQARLTKPAGSLGRLEDLSIQLAGFTKDTKAPEESSTLRVFESLWLFERHWA